MKINNLMPLLASILLLTTSFYTLAQESAPSVLSFKSCKIEISADQISYHHNSISFSGNVQFLYGLANVKTNSAVLTKKKDGSCELVAGTSNYKLG